MQVVVRHGQGVGSFVAGYKRVFDDMSSVDINAIAGLKSLVSVQTFRQLSPHTGVSLASTYQPGVGIGMQVRQGVSTTPIHT